MVLHFNDRCGELLPLQAINPSLTPWGQYLFASTFVRACCHVLLHTHTWLSRAASELHGLVNPAVHFLWREPERGWNVNGDNCIGADTRADRKEGAVPVNELHRASWISEKLHLSNGFIVAKLLCAILVILLIRVCTVDRTYWSVYRLMLLTYWQRGRSGYPWIQVFVLQDFFFFRCRYSLIRSSNFCEATFYYTNLNNLAFYNFLSLSVCSPNFTSCFFCFLAHWPHFNFN